MNADRNVPPCRPRSESHPVAGAVALARKETDGSFGVPFRRESSESALKIPGLPPPNPANLLSVQ